MRGNSPTKIAEELTSFALLENGLVFKKDTIRSILTNEKYTGRYVYGKTRNTKDGKKEKVDKNDWVADYEENHPAIISKEFYESVQSEIEKRRRNNSNKESVNDIRGENLLSGKIRCAKCGSHYRVTSSSSAKRYFYYICSKSNKEIKCVQGKIRKVQLEELVINLLASSLTLDELNNYYREEYLRVKARVKIDQDNIQPMMQKVQDLEKRKNIYNELLLEAKMKQDIKLVNNHEEQIRNLMGQINDLQDEILSKNIKFEMKEYPNFEEIISAIGSDIEEDPYTFIKSLSFETVKSIIHSSINEIVVEDIENSNESKVSITYQDSSTKEEIIERGVRNLPAEHEFDDDDYQYDTLVLLTNVMKEMKDRGWDFPI